MKPRIEFLLLVRFEPVSGKKWISFDAPKKQGSFSWTGDTTFGRQPFDRQSIGRLLGEGQNTLNNDLGKDPRNGEGDTEPTNYSCLALGLYKLFG